MQSLPYNSVAVRLHHCMKVFQGSDRDREGPDRERQTGVIMHLDSHHLRISPTNRKDARMALNMDDEVRLYTANPQRNIFKTRVTLYGIIVGRM